MGSLLRTAKKHKKSRRLGKPEVMAREEYQGWDDVEKARPEGEGRGSTGQGARARERPAPTSPGSGGDDVGDPKKNLRTTGDPPESTRERRERLIVAAEELAGRIGQTAEACEALGVARSTLYRRRQPVTPKPKRRPRPHRALDETEREEVLGALHCERFVDKAPAQVWATLLDEGTYLCSIRTMYRILEEHGEVRETPPVCVCFCDLHFTGIRALPPFFSFKDSVLHTSGSVPVSC